jgi:hypothetical protein
MNELKFSVAFWGDNTRDITVLVPHESRLAGMLSAPAKTSGKAAGNNLPPALEDIIATLILKHLRLSCSVRIPKSDTDKSSVDGVALLFSVLVHQMYFDSRWMPFCCEGMNFTTSFACSQRIPAGANEKIDAVHIANVILTQNGDGTVTAKLRFRFSKILLQKIDSQGNDKSAVLIYSGEGVWRCCTAFIVFTPLSFSVEVEILHFGQSTDSDLVTTWQADNKLHGYMFYVPSNSADWLTYWYLQSGTATSDTCVNTLIECKPNLDVSVHLSWSLVRFVSTGEVSKVPTSLLCRLALPEFTDRLPW